MPRALKKKNGIQKDTAGVQFGPDGPTVTEVIPHGDRMLMGDELARLIAEDESATAQFKLTSADYRLQSKWRKAQITRLALEVNTGTRKVSAQQTLPQVDPFAPARSFVEALDTLEDAAGDAAEPERDEVGF